MKAFTDIEQSRKLAEILPLESADMYFIGHQSITNPKEWKYENAPKVRGKYIAFDDKRIFYPCWSLAALLDVLPKIVNTQTLFIETSAVLWHIGYRDVYIARSENPVDACVEMIIKLKELKML